MCPPPPYTWKEQGGYQPVPPPPPPPVPMLFTPTPVLLAAPILFVPVKVAPLKGMAVAGSGSTTGKELVTTKTAVSSKTVVSTKSASKSSTKPASKSPSKPPSKAPSKPCSTSKTVVSETVISKKSSAKSDKQAAATASVASSSKTTKSAKAAKVKATTKPDAPLPGMKYIYPKKNTCVHVVKGTKLWEHADKDFKCKTFHVGTPMTVAELIEQLTGREGDKCKGWALTEVTEKGDGCFDKGTTVEFGGDKAGDTLAAVGWTDANGSARPPVWLVLHKG